jgi:hypothetical protein
MPLNPIENPSISLALPNRDITDEVASIPDLSRTNN